MAAIYPADVHLQIERVRGEGDRWVVEMKARYDGGRWMYGPAIYDFRDGKVARETIYVGEGWDPPEWRARWRAAPPREPDSEPTEAVGRT